jgi:hypothetical protein
MRRLKKYQIQILALSLLTIFIFSLVAPTPLLAKDTFFDRMIEGIETATNEAYGGGQKVDIKPTTFPSGLFIMINYLLNFLGVLFFLLLIYGGYLWMNARGQEEQLSKAKKIVREVVIGLIIIVLARVFTEFLLFQFRKAAGM